MTEMNKIQQIKLGKYLNIADFCTCTNTYKKYADKINPWPNNILETIPALQDLNKYILEPIIDNFGRERFKLTYGFCSSDLKKYLEKKDAITGEKNGRVAPEIDQHISYEMKKNGKYYCLRLGAACDFFIQDLPSNQLIDWILAEKLPFDSLYFYGEDKPIHISYGWQHKRDIWTFTISKQPTKKGIENWVDLAKKLR